MALNGNLNDLALLDILQIVAFSKKTGNLRIRCPLGCGGVVFKNGLIHYAYSPSTIDSLRDLEAGARSEEGQTVILEQMQGALRELVGLREGSFEFELTDRPPQELNGIASQSSYLDEGVDTQGLLLNLAKELDDERRQPTDLFESILDVDSAFDALQSDLSPGLEPSRQTESAGGEEPPFVILVDDEEMVTQIVAAQFLALGYDVRTASGPAEGLSAMRSLIDRNRQVLLVTDLRMPTSTGRSFLGGFELVRSLRREGVQVPVLLMIEKWTPKVRARAKKLGIRHVAFKPALSKLDPTQYSADLRSFAASLSRRLEELAKVDVRTKPDNTVPERPDRSAHLLDFLTSITAKLMNPSHQGDISKTVLLVASKYFERGILFLIKNQEARGLGGFGLADTPKASSELAQRLSIDVNHVAPFAEIVHSRSSGRLQNLDPLDSTLFSVIGRGRTEECIMIPMMNDGEVLAILYGDNHATGKPLGKLRGLELFVAQASMALEILSLQRKLAFLQSRFFSESEKTTKK